MVDTKKQKQRARILIDAAFRQAEKGSLGHFNAIQRMLEEDTTSTRVELTANSPAPKPKLSLQEFLAAFRHIYGLGDPEDPMLKAAYEKSPNFRTLIDSGGIKYGAGGTAVHQEPAREQLAAELPVSAEAQPSGHP